MLLRRLPARLALALLAALIGAILLLQFAPSESTGGAVGASPPPGADGNLGQMESPDSFGVRSERSESENRGEPAKSAQTPEPQLPSEVAWIRALDAATLEPVARARAVGGAASFSDLAWTADAEGLIRIDVQAEYRRTGRERHARARGFPVTVSSEIHGPALLRLDPDSMSSMTPFIVRLERAAQLRWTLLDDAGQPLSGAKLRVSTTGSALLEASAGPMSVARDSVMSLRSDPFSGSARWQGGAGNHDWLATSDANGLAIVLGLPARVSLDIAILSEGVTYSVAFDPDRLEPGELRDAIWVRPRSLTLRGRVVDPTSDPSRRWRVWLVEARGVEAESRFLDTVGPVAARVVTSPGGQFEFPALPSGDYFCGLDPTIHPAGLTAAVRVRVQGVEPLQAIELRPAADTRLEGRLWGAADESESFTITAQRPGVGGALTTRASADENFRFQFDPCPAGEWVLSGEGDRGTQLEGKLWNTSSGEVVLSTRR